MRSLNRLICLFLLLLIVAGCSAYSKQMRQAKKQSKQNVQRQEERKSQGLVPSDLPAKDDVNYKDLDKIRHRCLYIKDNGERCTRKATKNGKYCWWHNPKEKI